MIKRVTNDAREDEMEENLGQVSLKTFKNELFRICLYFNYTFLLTSKKPFQNYSENDVILTDIRVSFVEAPVSLARTC